jgi:hypothetical protein
MYNVMYLYIKDGSDSALRVGNECHGLKPIIFRGPKYFIIPIYYIENKKSVIFKERKHSIINKKSQLYLKI